MKIDRYCFEFSRGKCWRHDGSSIFPLFIFEDGKSMIKDAWKPFDSLMRWNQCTAEKKTPSCHTRRLVKTDESLMRTCRNISKSATRMQGTVPSWILERARFRKQIYSIAHPTILPYFLINSISLLLIPWMKRWWKYVWFNRTLLFAWHARIRPAMESVLDQEFQSDEKHYSLEYNNYNQIHRSLNFNHQPFENRTHV